MSNDVAAVLLRIDTLTARAASAYFAGRTVEHVTLKAQIKAANSQLRELLSPPDHTEDQA